MTDAEAAKELKRRDEMANEIRKHVEEQLAQTTLERRAIVGRLTAYGEAFGALLAAIQPFAASPCGHAHLAACPFCVARQAAALASDAVNMKDGTEL